MKLKIAIAFLSLLTLTAVFVAGVFAGMSREKEKVIQQVERRVEVPVVTTVERKVYLGGRRSVTSPRVPEGNAPTPSAILPSPGFVGVGPNGVGPSAVGQNEACLIEETITTSRPVISPTAIPAPRLEADNDTTLSALVSINSRTRKALVGLSLQHEITPAFVVGGFVLSGNGMRRTEVVGGVSFGLRF